jgi:hypothetical protein
VNYNIFIFLCFQEELNPYALVIGQYGRFDLKTISNSLHIISLILSLISNFILRTVHNSVLDDHMNKLLDTVLCRRDIGALL